MKRVVSDGDLTQHAMRPANLQEAYLARVEEDIVRFRLLAGAVDRPCPACGGAGPIAFVRLGFSYVRCAGCQSLFVSPLPDRDRLARYFEEGTAEAFRRETMLAATADVRVRHALRPRAQWVMMAAARLGPRSTMIQFGARAPELAEMLHGSVSLQPWTSAGRGAAADGVIAFDVLERAFDLDAALRECRAALRPRGLLFVTTMSGEGFEVRMLGSQTRSLVPPVHLQLLSRKAWALVLGRHGLSIVEYSTPGELDVQAVAEMCRADPELPLPAILDELIRSDDEAIARTFQGLLQQAGLSSHVQLVAEATSDATTQ